MNNIQNVHPPPPFRVILNLHPKTYCCLAVIIDAFCKVCKRTGFKKGYSMPKYFASFKIFKTLVFRGEGGR